MGTGGGVVEAGGEEVGEVEIGTFGDIWDIWVAWVRSARARWIVEPGGGLALFDCDCCSNL